jgi:hypothetical protein
MALIIKTQDPNGLLRAIKREIDAKHVDTWVYDNDGDFTHNVTQWDKKAWMRPKVYVGELRFGILGPRGEQMTKVIYAVYHGRFSEMLLAHCDTLFTSINATANKTVPDSFT